MSKNLIVEKIKPGDEFVDMFNFQVKISGIKKEEESFISLKVLRDGEKTPRYMIFNKKEKGIEMKGCSNFISNGG